MDIELGTVFGESCSNKLLQWLLSHFKHRAANLKDCKRKPIIVANQELFGEPVIAVHRVGDNSPDYPGYGHRFNTVQIEIAHWLRTAHKKDLVNLLTSIIAEFRTFVIRKVP